MRLVAARLGFWAASSSAARFLLASMRSKAHSQGPSRVNRSGGGLLGRFESAIPVVYVGGRVPGNALPFLVSFFGSPRPAPGGRSVALGKEVSPCAASFPGS